MIIGPDHHVGEMCEDVQPCEQVPQEQDIGEHSTIRCVLAREARQKPRRTGIFEMCPQTCSARQDRTAIAALITTYQGRCNATFDSSCMSLEVGLVRSQSNLGRQGRRSFVGQAIASSRSSSCSTLLSLCKSDTNKRSHECAKGVGVPPSSTTSGKPGTPPKNANRNDHADEGSSTICCHQSNRCTARATPVGTNLSSIWTILCACARQYTLLHLCWQIERESEREREGEREREKARERKRNRKKQRKREK